MNSAFLDFRSDTVTQPTPAMREAMAAAVVGDDLLGEDPTVARLEAMAAERFGKEAGLLVISGTMANQVAVMTLAGRGDEILAGEEAHIYNLEVGGVAALSGVQIRPLRASAGRFDPSDVRRAIRRPGIQSPETRVLCLENTYDLNRGIALDAGYVEEIAGIAHAQGVSVYLDGARIFNAAACFGTTVRDLCAPVDCLQFCLSKGLAAPLGAVLVGPRETIEPARRMRQRLGGGMRQAGHLAAAGIVALETMSERLAEDHANAARLAAGLAAIDDRLVAAEAPATNIVHVNLGAAGFDAELVTSSLFDLGVRIKPLGEGACRMVTHWGLSRDDIDVALDLMRGLLQRLKTG